MKTRFLKAFAAVVMLFSFAGFVRAEGELTITASIANAGENVVLSEITGNACSATDVVLSADTKLTLTCAGADIYYTTDGTKPSKLVVTEPAAKEGESTSTLYADPFVLTNAMVADGKIVVKAIAYKQAAPDQGAKATAEESDILTITLTLKVEAPEPDPIVAPTFNPAAGEVEANTTVELSTTTTGATIFWAFAENKTAGSYLEFKEDSKPEVTAQNLKLWAFARTGAAESDYAYSDTVAATYTIKAVTPEPTKPAAPTFVKKTGTAADTIIVIMGSTNDSLFVATGRDSISAVAAGFVKFLKNDTIAVTKDTVVVAYAMKGELFSDTVKYVYTKTETPEVSVQMGFVPYGFEYDGTVQTEITAGYGMPVMVGVSVMGTEDEYLPAEIYYTLDGTTEPSKEAYTEDGTIIKKLEAPESQAELMFDTAVAAAKFKAYVENGEDIIESDVQTIKVNFLKAAKPSFSPKAGAIMKGKTVAISTKLGESAMIFYTTDGTTEPDMLAEEEGGFSYEEPIAIPADSTSLTIKARVYTSDEETGVLYSSEVVTAKYNVWIPDTIRVNDLSELVALYSSYKKDSLYVVKGEVTIAGILEGSNRTDVLVQDKNCEDAKGHSMLLYNVTLPENAKVGDVLKDLSGMFDKFNGLLELKEVSVVAAGTTAPITIDTVTIAELKADETMAYQSAMVCMEEVEFDCDTIFALGKSGLNYDLIQGTDTLTFRTNAGADYLGMEIPSGKITLVGYIGYYGKAYQVSPRSKADIITGEQPAKPAKPTFDPAAGAVTEGTTVTVSSTTEGAEIWIAVGEGEFEKKSEVTISEAVTLRAFAAKDGVNSDTATASYTIKTANEGNELAGVSVYPNPNDGVFYVTVPVNAMVEVFTMNGQMVASKMVAAGRNAMRLESAGMYFVRVRANGQEAIKKVVVR